MPFIQKHLPLAGSLKKTFKIRKTQIIIPNASQVGVIYECNLVALWVNLNFHLREISLSLSMTSIHDSRKINLKRKL